jgi:hypothetical protein
LPFKMSASTAGAKLSASRCPVQVLFVQVLFVQVLFVQTLFAQTL